MKLAGGSDAPGFLIHREYWEPLDLLDYALRVWRGDGRVEHVTDDSPERLRFHARAWKSFEGRGFPVKRVRTWVNVMLPTPDLGWDVGYPHVHADSTALTLIHYIDPSDVASPLEVFEGDEIVETIYPEANLTVFVPNGVRHGVRKNNGTRKRVAMIATAYP